MTPPRVWLTHLTDSKFFNLLAYIIVSALNEEKKNGEKI